MAALVSLLIVVDDGGGLIISMASKFNGEKDYGNLWIGRTKNMLDRLNSALPGGRLTRFGQFTKNIFFACHSSLALVCFLLTLSQSLSSLTGINKGSDWLMFRRGRFRVSGVGSELWT